jgi:hypothetical protein
MLTKRRRGKKKAGEEDRPSERVNKIGRVGTTVGEYACACACVGSEVQMQLKQIFQE